MVSGFRFRRPAAGVLLLVLACCGGVAGCAKAQAKSAPVGVPLQVPQPPPRVIAAVEDPVTPPPEEAPAPAAAKPAPAASRPRIETKPEPPQVEPPPPPPPAVADTRPVEPRTLRAPGDAARERAIRDRLSGASRDLSKVNYARLSTGARGQYDQSKRFIQQAEQAIKEQNLTYASTLADKAATLASDLVGR